MKLGARPLRGVRRPLTSLRVGAACLSDRPTLEPARWVPRIAAACASCARSTWPAKTRRSIWPNTLAHDCDEGMIVRAADRDPARSYERLDESDLARLGRAAEAELSEFFARNPRLDGWQDRVRIIALAQGGAEHYLRGRRGIWDLDVIVCFAEDPRLPRGSSAARSSPGTGVLPNSGAARTTHRNTSAALLMSSSGLSPTGRTRSPGYENGWRSVQRKRSTQNGSLTSHTSQLCLSSPTSDRLPGTPVTFLPPGPRRMGIASLTAGCRPEARQGV